MPELNISAPEGARFEFDEVKTAKGTQSLGEQPILVWEQVDAARAAYGDEGVLNILDGTSVRVSMQSIARRGALAKKTFDEIAKMQIDFRPGKRVGGKSTPESRAANSARKAATKLGAEGSDAIQALLEKVASGEVTQEQLAALLGG